MCRTVVVHQLVRIHFTHTHTEYLRIKMAQSKVLILYKIKILIIESILEHLLICIGNSRFEILKILSSKDLQ